VVESVSRGALEILKPYVFQAPVIIFLVLNRLHDMFNYLLTTTPRAVKDHKIN